MLTHISMHVWSSLTMAKEDSWVYFISFDVLLENNSLRTNEGEDAKPNDWLFANILLLE